MNHRATLAVGETTGASARFARVLPLAFVTYSLAYLDRMNIQYAAASGMKESLGASDKVFTLFNASFFIGYVLFQIPGASYAAKYSVKRLMFWSLIAWGILASLTGFLTSIPLLVVDRILLGAVEGVVFPGLLVFLTHWFTKPERSRANVVLILGNPLTLLWASVFSGYLIAHFNTHPLFGLPGWRLMFLAEGLPTLIWAGIWWFLSEDRPAEAPWISPEQAAAIQYQLDEEQRHIPGMRDYWAAFLDPKVIIISLLFFAWSLGIYGLNSWLAVIVKRGSGLGIATTGLLNSIPYAFGMVAMLAVSFASDKTLIRKAFVWPCMFLGAAAFLLSYLSGPTHFWWAFTGLIVACACMYAPYGPFWAMVPELVPRNVVGESLALVNTIGAVGGFAGTWFVGLLNYATGSPGPGFICMGSALFAAGVLTLAVRPRPAVLV
jgi:sugar phosphate permease